MEDRRIDDLTKLVGRRASRRAVIKAAIAGAIASVFGSSLAEAALASRNDPAARGMNEGRVA